MQGRGGLEFKVRDMQDIEQQLFYRLYDDCWLDYGIVWTKCSGQVMIKEIILSKAALNKLVTEPEMEEGVENVVNQLAAEIQRYLDGENVLFSLANLDLTQLSPFQRVVLERLYQVPYGTVVSYKELAALAGSQAVRAVGSVMRKNPFPLVFPCHRVIKSDGTSGRYQPGTDVKIKLLALEKAGLNR